MLVLNNQVIHMRVQIYFFSQPKTTRQSYKTDRNLKGHSNNFFVSSKQPFLSKPSFPFKHMARYRQKVDTNRNSRDKIELL